MAAHFMQLHLGLRELLLLRFSPRPLREEKTNYSSSNNSNPTRYGGAFRLKPMTTWPIIIKQKGAM